MFCLWRKCKALFGFSKGAANWKDLKTEVVFLPTTLHLTGEIETLPLSLFQAHLMFQCIFHLSCSKQTKNPSVFNSLKI